MFLTLSLGVTADVSESCWETADTVSQIKPHKVKVGGSPTSVAQTTMMTSHKPAHLLVKEKPFCLLKTS